MYVSGGGILGWMEEVIGDGRRELKTNRGGTWKLKDQQTQCACQNIVINNKFRFCFRVYHE
jgi:hypothetical protein